MKKGRWKVQGRRKKKRMNHPRMQAFHNMDGQGLSTIIGLLKKKSIYYQQKLNEMSCDR